MEGITNIIWCVFKPFLALSCRRASFFLLSLVAVMTSKGSKRKTPEVASTSASSSTVTDKDPYILEMAQRKLNENFKILNTSECNIVTNPVDGLAFRQRLTRDCVAKKKGQQQHTPNK